MENQIKAQKIGTMDNVFDNPVAKEMILKEKIGNQETKRIASIAFTITCQSIKPLTSESIWLTTSNQLEIDQLDVQIADWSNSIALKSVGPYARLLINEDIYQFGF